MVYAGVMSNQNPLHIIELQVQNLMGIKAVHLRLDGSALVRIEGRNGAGKSSLITAIETLICGKGAAPEVPVRKGSKKATVEADLGELTVKRTWTDGGSMTLEVRGKDGQKYATPQQVLDALYGQMLDPVAFMRMKPADRATELRRVVGLDLSDLDQERQTIFDRRTEVNREAKTAEARLPEPVTPPPGGLPDKPIDIMNLSAEYGEATKHNAEIESRKAALHPMRDRKARLTADIADLEARLALAKQELELVNQAGKTESAAVAALVPIDIEVIGQRLRSAAVVNKMIAQRDERRRQRGIVDGLNTQAASLTRDLDRIDEVKSKRLALVKFPIEGLGIDGDTVLFNGLPIDQAPSSVQLRVGVAIGLAQNPRLRVMLVREGSLLDEAALAMLAPIAQEHQAQVFVERVADTANPAAVVISDGEVASAPVGMMQGAQA